jgi:hypothetical protein
MVLLLGWLGMAHAFVVVPSEPGRQIRVDQRMQRLLATLEQGEAKGEQLVFRTAISAQSGPLQHSTAPTTLDSALAFFSSKDCLYHFTSGGGKNSICETVLSPELTQYWQEMCKKGYGPEYLPQSSSSVIATATTMSFPGLTLTNNVYNGILRKSSTLTGQATEHASFNTVLVAEKQSVSGAPPIVWIFNQLTGRAGNNEGNAANDSAVYTKPSGFAKSKVSLISKEDGGTNQLSYCIDFQCNIDITLTFPKLLLKVLPTSKEKMEEQGSASVSKAISRDVLQAVNTVNDAFVKWQLQQ